MLNQDFREFIQSLNDNLVHYLVIGGYAVAFHGYPRYTKDIDILTTLPGVEFDECYLKRIQTEIEGVMVDLIDIESLRKNKKVSGRMQDLADLEQLE